MEPKSRDRPGRTSRELSEESRYYQNMSPGFDGIERRNYKHYHEDDRGDSHRYPRKDGSRSRSRSRSPRGWVRSGSPRLDYKNQSHKWNDQRSEPDKQFQICRDFSAGRCRKGSQCHFEHSRNTSRGYSSKDSYIKDSGPDLRADVPRYYHGEERQFWKKSRNLVPCRELMKGWCKWGDSCRFSHHLASNETADMSYPGDNSNLRYDSRSSLRTENEDASWRTRELEGIGVTGYIDKENVAHKQENNNMSRGFTSQNEVGNVGVQEQQTLLDHGVVENGMVTSFGPDVLDQAENSSNPTHPCPFPGQNESSENVQVPMQFSVSNATDVWQNMLNGGLDGLETQAGARFDLQSQVSNHQHQRHARPHLDSHSQVLNNMLEIQSGARLDLHSQVPNHQFETQSGAHFDLHSQVNNHLPEPESGAPLDLRSQVKNHELETQSGANLENRQRAVQILTGLLESKVTFPVGFPHGPINHVEKDTVANNEHGKYTEQHNQVQTKQASPVSAIGKGRDNPKVDDSENSKQQEEVPLSKPVADEGNKAVDEENKGVKDSKKAEANAASKDEKAMRLLKHSLVEFVKDILKPTWKEGRLSRDVHKTIVKKVVDKVTGTVQPDHAPKTQDKVDQYLSSSKPKISKLVQAYVERSQKTDS
ncbi:Unknown protein [Striga hermonthica]|uniref:C3H1-type domain-containing protein n=1 Tax=Striga hermonthica TaxID=68872 RepID=A0A9N7MSV0_STRHE|nr:Unknown protein [Striga hermonthica]